ncbi:tyramine receptor Ser-2-like [Apostichopus japonicus]|uniref:tyramine receptor Ser-2-like n=1 Tax=Stichopus japonicus TaxID=307972 RepID=UPI003AB4AEC5
MASTVQDLQLSRFQSTVLVISYLSLAAAVILGNSCVIVAYVKDAKVRALPFNVYIFALSITDLAVGIFNLPYHSLTVLWPGVEYANFYVSVGVLYVAYIIAITSVFLVVAMTVDRLRLISSPTKYSHKCNRGSNMRIISCVVLFSFVYCFVLLVLRALLRKEDSSCFKNLPYLVSMLIGNVFIPVSTLITLNLRLVWKLHSHFKEMKRSLKAADRKDEIRRGRSISGSVDGTTGVMPGKDQIGHNLQSRPKMEHVDKKSVSIGTKNAIAHSMDLGDVSESGQTQQRSVGCGGASFLGDPTQANKVLTTGSCIATAASHRPTWAQRDHGSVVTKKEKLPSSRKMAKHMVLFVYIYLCCWIPSHAYFLVKAVTGVPLYNPMDLLQHVFYIFLYVNSALNPFLYAAMGVRFRLALIGLFLKQSTKPADRRLVYADTPVSNVTNSTTGPVSDAI